MVASLTPETGLRRTDFDGETFLVYLDPVGARRGRRELERFIPHPLTSAAIHRSSKPLIFDALAQIRGTVVKKPIHIGDVVIADVCGTGVDVVATANRE